MALQSITRTGKIEIDRGSVLLKRRAHRASQGSEPAFKQDRACYPERFEHKHLIGVRPRPTLTTIMANGSMSLLQDRLDPCGDSEKEDRCAARDGE